MKRKRWPIAVDRCPIYAGNGRRRNRVRAAIAGLCGSFYVTNQLHPPTATIAMADIQTVLHSAIEGILSDRNYKQPPAFYLLWSDIGQTYFEIPSDQILNAIWNKRPTDVTITKRNQSQSYIQSSYGYPSQELDHISHKLIHPTAHSILRFASDAESDLILAPQNSGLQRRLCAKTLQDFFSSNLTAVLQSTDAWREELRERCQGEYIQKNQKDTLQGFYGDANFIAHWANLGYVEEAAIRNHILQSLISHPKLHGHQADALIILFKLAGATFEAYVDPAVVDRCFELLKDNYTSDSTDWVLFQVRVFHVVKDGHRAKTNFQEVVALRERGWEGLPPPPVFAAGKSKPTGADQKDPAATPVATSLGLPSGDPEPQIPQHRPLESAAIPETDAEIPASPIIQSPSISIATLSDFTIADTSDDESPIDTTIADASDNELSTEPTATAPHETFYLQDGNVEVLCGHTLFRVHTSVLSFHSPALHRLFAQTSLDTAESPNGCPRILSSDIATDFAMLLKMIYLPG
jgi:hypothetical protein